jgi:hypothetical protein
VAGKEQNRVIGAFLTFSSVLVQKGFPRGAITGFFSVAEFISGAGSLGNASETANPQTPAGGASANTVSSST